MMKFFLLFLSAVAGASAGFIPSIRVDHESRGSRMCYNSAIVLGPEDSFSQPVYVVFENDSFAGSIIVQQDIYFQRSTDGGLTWLSEDRLVRRGAPFACYPDIAVDRSGCIYIVYTERTDNTAHICCIRSTDRGESWSEPVRVDDNGAGVMAGWARVAVDTGGNLFCAWNDRRLGRMTIWSAVSTDGGRSWSADVRVDDDTVPGDCFHTDVFVQPGTNHYLVTATTPFWVRPGYINSNASFFRSTDQGRTFEPGVVIDTFSDYCGQPHVVADAGHIICDWTGSGAGMENSRTEARVLFTPGDSWSMPVAVSELDTLYTSYYNGGKLAIDPNGNVHCVLMLAEVANYNYDIFYAFSDCHGLVWQEREPVNDVKDENQWDPDIAVDRNGIAYVVWQDWKNGRGEIWFSTNRQTGVAENRAEDRPLVSITPNPFRERVVIFVNGTPAQKPVLEIFDRTGRRIRILSITANQAVWDGRDEYGVRVEAGAYFLCYGGHKSRLVLVR